MSTNSVPPPRPRRTPPDIFEANLGGVENPDFEDGEPWATGRPRIRATTLNPSRTVRDAKRRDVATGRPYTSIDATLEKFNALYAWAEQNDPQPAWWKRRARREWRNRWGLT